MENYINIDDTFINNNTHFKKLIQLLKRAFASKDTITPQRHHHDFPNPRSRSDSTLL